MTRTVAQHVHCTCAVGFSPSFVTFINCSRCTTTDVLRGVVSIHAGETASLSRDCGTAERFLQIGLFQSSDSRARRDILPGDVLATRSVRVGRTRACRPAASDRDKAMTRQTGGGLWRTFAAACAATLAIYIGTSRHPRM
jgi:hypothetical protein